MGQYVFKLPDVGEGTAEAEIAAWHVAVGDMVTEDQHLVDIMTDKAVVEIPSPVAGRIVALHGAAGEMRPVGGALIEFEVEGAGNAKAAAPPKPVEAAPVAVKPPEPKPVEAKPAPTAPAPGAREAAKPAFATRAAGDKPLASPAVRKRAWDLGIELQFVPGTGPAGRIGHDDLDGFIASGGTAKAAGPARDVKREGVEEIKIIGLRRKIAEKMQEAKRRIPHFSYIEEIDVTALEELRQHLNATKKADRPKLTILPFLMRAMTRVLPDYPQINARFDDEAGIVHRYAPVHIGIATQTANGLIVPVVHHADALDIWQSATEVARVSTAARENKATKDELTGSTITITSLGPLGGLVTTPVINHPEVAIVGPNAILDRPVVRGGQIVVRKIMNLSSSFDHRVVDGYDAAEFIQRVKALLEHPALLFME